MTAGALQAIEESGLAVPEEMAVVGYDEISWAPLLRTALTTVSQPAYDLGHESARLLLSRLNGYAGPARTVLLPTSLNIRASSAPRQHGDEVASRPRRTRTPSSGRPQAARRRKLT